VKLIPSMVIALALLGAAPTARADFSKEATPPASAPAASLDAAQKKADASDYRGAIAILNDVIKANPNNADALNLMGFCLRKTGQADLALQYYNKALALMPKHLGANEYLGELYVELGQMDKARERLAVLQAACGNCQQAQNLTAAISKGPGTKTGAWR
jgi:tetratricopeptide (TPR) repeat protein